jgi:hypothetical protein
VETNQNPLLRTDFDVFFSSGKKNCTNKEKMKKTLDKERKHV